jgi:hypothetical protein
MTAYAREERLKNSGTFAALLRTTNYRDSIFLGNGVPALRSGEAFARIFQRCEPALNEVKRQRRNVRCHDSL